MKIYLDHVATCPLDERVAKKMDFKEFGNPSSVHYAARPVQRAITDAREHVAELINCKPEEIYFTSSGAEANNFALKGLAFAKKKGHILVSSIEHFSVLQTAKWLEKLGFKVETVPVDKYGMVRPEDVKSRMRKDTILVSIMLANHEVGTIQPIKEISKIVHSGDALLHTDATSAVGWIDVDVKKLGVDMLTMSAHRFYGPKAIGALYVRNGVSLVPLIHGGIQERGRRGGIENVPGIIGMGEAAKIAKRDLKKIKTKVLPLRQRLEDGIKKIEHVKLNGHPTKRLPGHVNFSFEGIEGESTLYMLGEEGIAAATGSACTSKALKASHVLTAMGIAHEIAHGSILFSIGKENTGKEIDFTLKILEKIVERLRAMSPLEK